MTAKENEEFIILKEDVKHIKADVEHIKENSTELNENMTRITSKLFKDELTGEEGFFEVTRKNGIKLSSMEKRYAITIGIVAGVFMYIGYMLRIIKQ